MWVFVVITTSVFLAQKANAVFTLLVVMAPRADLAFLLLKGGSKQPRGVLGHCPGKIVEILIAQYAF